MADERDPRADERDRVADMRDQAADRRDQAAERREPAQVREQDAIDSLHAGRDRDEAAADRAAFIDRSDQDERQEARAEQDPVQDL
jgi:hypothetical protein